MPKYRGPPDMIDDHLERARLLLLEHGGEGGETMLYANWYHRETEETRFYPSASALCAAILDSDRLEPGWRVTALNGNGPAAVTAERAGEMRAMAPPEYVPAQAGNLLPQIGQHLLADPIASAELDGFWHMFSPEWRKALPPSLSRVYFAVRSGSECAMAATIAARAPLTDNWAFKILCGHHRLGRRDIAVFYHAADQSSSTGWLADIIEAAEDLTEGPLPPLVQPLRPGVGVAPEPGTGESFGQAICRRLAEAANDREALGNASRWRSAARSSLAELLPDAVVA
jgi:HopA1 effector protein family